MIIPQILSWILLVQTCSLHSKIQTVVEEHWTLSPALPNIFNVFSAISSLQKSCVRIFKPNQKTEKLVGLKFRVQKAKLFKCGGFSIKNDP